MTLPNDENPSQVPDAGGEGVTESTKRRDIIDGARRVFFDKGFDGASMDEIARAAGVSKATIYAYFGSKEELFQTLVEVDRQKSAERLFEFDAEYPEVGGLLTRIGASFMTMMIRPDHIRLIRLVIGAAEKFPRIGQAFFETGPCKGGKRLSDLLADQVRLGRLCIDDCDEAAFQFFNLCQGNIVKGLLFGGISPTPEMVDAAVKSAVRVFLAAYAPADRQDQNDVRPDKTA